jgi:hypothetical protein
MMNEVYYAVDGRGKITPMQRKDLFAASDDLKSLLERNPGLIAGDPGASEESGWLLVREALEVEDPEFGDPPWVADLVFADHDRTPVFVQCVPSLEERTRREIIGEVMEHVASVQSCFGRAKTPEAWGVDAGELEKRISRQKNGSSESTDSFLGKVAERLSAGHLRLTYVTGQCPQEFKRVVDFLNRQMEHLQVVVVEVQEFRANGFRMLIPTLFSSSAPEAAAAVVEEPAPPPVPSSPAMESLDELLDSSPLEVTLEPEGFDDFDEVLEEPMPEPAPEPLWDEPAFFTAIETQLARSQVQAIRTFHQSLQKLNLEVRWGGDPDVGSLEVVIEAIVPDPIMTLHTDGELILDFGNLSGEERLEDLQQRMRSIIDDRLGVVFHLDDLFPSMSPADWCPKVTGLLRVLDDLGKVAKEDE